MNYKIEKLNETYIKMDLTSAEFPYYKCYHQLPYVLKNYNNLQDYKEDRLPAKGHKVIFFLKIDFKRAESYLRITDYFSEDVRVKCNFRDRISPLEYFKINRENIVSSLGQNPTYKEIDSYLYDHGPRQCSNFNLLVSYSVLKHFKPKRWLDPSAGWGDRLITAISYGCEYRATDPNHDMHEKYTQMIDVLSKDKTKYNITEEGFEDADIEEDYYDLVFTSPPFFDLEKYGNGPKQSMIKFSTLEKWKDGFLYPLVSKSIRALTDKGHLALYVSDGGNKYVKDMCEFINSHENMHFKGYIKWKADSRPKDIKVWQKIN